MANIITRSLKSKLIVLFLLVSLVPIAIIGYVSYSSGKATIQKQFLDNLTAIAKSRENNVLTHLRRRMEQIEILAANELVQTLIEGWNKKEKGETVDEAALQKKADNFIEVELPEYHDITTFYDYTFIGESGKVYFSTDKSIVGEDMSGDEIFQRGLKEKFYTDMDIDKKNRQADLWSNYSYISS